ncbi:MAG: hypothetical protein QM820_21215 [Minicystis sp.]
MPFLKPSASRPARDSERSPLLSREQRRLRNVFTALLAAVAPAAAVQACGDPAGMMSGLDAGTEPDAGADTGTTMDAGPDVTAQSDAADGGDASDGDASKDCMMKVTVFDSGADAEPGCIYKLPCGLSQGLVVMGCDLYSTPDIPLGCTVEEGYGCEADAFAPGPGGEVHIVCPECLGAGGRRPSGLARPRALGATTAAGAYFARMTHDEAASVHAFMRMRDELVRLGAPAYLVGAADQSARDEVRHARAMARHARRHGAPIPAVRVRRHGSRSIEAIARENAVEGCVNETFGALLAAWQAAHAPDAEVRRTFARIAADEARHAALSWAVARWIEDRLGPRERARVAAARARAIRALRRCAVAAPFDAAVGRPTPRQRAALVEGMIRQLALS